jgi:S1-C subfamily serine protease
MAKHVMDQLIATGTVRRGKLGVTVQRITPDLASSLGLPNTRGALISGVVDGSPAAKAGLRQGDVVTSYNGKAVEDNNQLRNSVANTKPGSTVALQVLRNGRTETVQATVAELEPTRERVSSPSAERGEGRFGMTLESGSSGVTVVEVDPSGAAAESDLRPGDVIEKVDGRSVRTAAELKSVLDRTDGKPSLLLVNRDGTTIFLTLRSK